MKKKNKIAIIATHSNSIKSFMLNHIRKLSINYDIFIFCNEIFTLKKILPKNIKIRLFKIKRKPNIFSDLKSLFYLIKVFYKINFYIAFSITPKAGFLTAISAFIMGVPNRFHWFTGQVWCNYRGAKKFFFKCLDILIFKFSTHVLVDSKSQRNFLIKNRVLSEKKSKVLHKGSVSGVDIKKFNFRLSIRNLLRKKLLIPKSSFVYLFLGRVNCDKGIYELVNVFQKISITNKKLFLLIVGPVEDSEIKNKFSKFKNNIIFVDSVENPQDWYCVADVLCLPSHREGFGSVIIEAAACGIPALASNIYGIKDAIVSNQTGLLHKVNNEKDLEKKMLYLLKRKKLIKEFGKNAKKRVKIDFNNHIMTKKLIEFIEQQK